jgi:hypothetical protein
MAADWYKGKLRRNLVDMHIDAGDEHWLSRFDPDAYVANLKRAHVQAAMIYANSHVGYCYWPTAHGAMHPGLKDRNVLHRLFDACHAEGMDVIVYYSLVFDNWAYQHHPSWRMIDADGRPSREPRTSDPMILMPSQRGSRYGVCCPNAEGYRRYMVAQIEDFCTALDFEGIFFDMTFWPFPCYCDACRRRYRAEVGGRIPVVVDWKDPGWLAFQKKREDWLVEFGSLATGTTKRCRPGVSVNHQFSTAQSPWVLGVTERQREFCDYLGGDFYEDFAHQIFFCKLFRNISPSLPFEFHTSRCTNLRDHTTMKSRDELGIMNALTLVHQGATLFIDAIDPEGTMNPQVYQRFAEVFEESIPFEGLADGEMLQDVAVYYNQDSKMDPGDNGKRVTGQLSFSMPHLQAAKRAVTTLGHAHIPYGVIGASCIERLGAHRVLVLPYTLTLRQEEATAIREFVRAGGSLYASGLASAEVLGDVLGVHPEGLVGERLSYIAPTSLGAPLMPGVSTRYPLMVSHPAARAKAHDAREVAATITLPGTDPDDPSRFVSIHSDPPCKPTDLPGVVCHSFGAGRSIWIAAPLEDHAQHLHRTVFLAMIGHLASGPWSFEVSAPPAVEALVYLQQVNARFVVCLVNVQELQPTVPVHAIRVRVRLDGRKPLRALLLPHERELPMTVAGEFAEFVLPELITVAIVAVTFIPEH